MDSCRVSRGLLLQYSVFGLALTESVLVVGNIIYRGHFKATGKEDEVNISLSTGPSGAGTVWLNGAFLGSGMSLSQFLLISEPH